MDEKLQIILETIREIEPLDEDAVAFAKARQASLAKPPESLGKLEDMAVKLAGIRGKETVKGGKSAGGEPGGGSPGGGNAGRPLGSVDGEPGGENAGRPLGPGCVMTFCADNGVAEQGVASAPQSVTRAQTINFTRRLTGVGALAESFGSELLIVDMGVKDPIPAGLYDDIPFRDTRKIIDRRIGAGTGDLSLGPAMTEEEAVGAVSTGIEMSRAAAEEGFEILGIGEMGIGNTTTSAAVLSALTGADADRTCGRGGGVNDEGFLRKKEIVEEVSAEFRRGGGIIDALAGGDERSGDEDSKARSGDEDEARISIVMKVLAKCGGFDICAMAGAYLGAAACRIPVVIDGYISAVAALAAATICPTAKDYMFASHRSAEPGYMLAVEKLGLDPFLDLGMRLGEGSGCPIAFSVIRGAWDVMNNMATFSEAQIDDDYLEEVRGNRSFRG